MKKIQHANSGVPTNKNRLHSKGLVLLMIATLLMTAILSFTPGLTYAASESTLTLECNKDAYIDEQYPNQNFGANNTLLVRSGPSGNARVYLGFPFETIPRASAILNANITVYLVDVPPTPRKYVMQVVQANWNESEITWSNQPWWGYETSKVSVSPDLTQVTFDVTQAIQEYSVMGMSLTGFMIRDEKEGDWRGPIKVAFASRENPLGLSAVLKVKVSYEPDFLFRVMPDYQSAFQSGTATYWYALASLNQWEGTINLKVQGLHSTMTVTFDNNPVNLWAGDMRFGQLWITTASNTPAGSYTLTVNGTSGTKTHSSSVVLKVTPRILTRNLPNTAANNTDFEVTLTYQAGGINATSLVIEENIPQWTNITFTDGQPNIVMPNTEIASFKFEPMMDNRTRLKFLIANRTALGSFNITYKVHYSYTGPPEGKPYSLHFDGCYNYLLVDGTRGGDTIQGDYEVQIPIGLPGQWDDDGRVDDWEILEVISAWIRGQLTDEDLLFGYIPLWQKTK